MSFRSKLALFFVLVVVVPMASIAFVLFRLIDDNETGKADARLAARQDVAVNLTRELRTAAGRIAAVVARDPAFAGALNTGDDEALRARVRVLVRRSGATRIAVVRDGRELADSGEPAAVFASVQELSDGRGRPRGVLEVAVAAAQPFAERVRRTTGLDAAVAIGGELAGATLRGVIAGELPARDGTLTARGTDYRGATYEAPGFDGQTVRVTVMEPASITAAERRRSRALVAALMLGFLLIALTLAWFVARSLHRQLERFLDAARRIGRGDYTARVPTVGHDDLAALGSEFNRMALRLEGRERELRVERERLSGALRRIGQALASNLDRDALLDVVIGSAADGVGAQAGRATVRSGWGSALVPVAVTGDVAAFDAVLEKVERAALGDGHAAEAGAPGIAALAVPLRHREGPASAVVAIARVGEPFTSGQREAFEYLAQQTAASIENVDLHERIERQAVTDPLTGLANRRRFEARLVEEVERARRLHETFGLVLLDIDEFKLVNDRYGHLAGDDVLREVARIVRENARDIDLPVRFGGEELALLLPGADAEGAEQAAERVRTAIEQADMPVDTGGGPPLRVTVSAGAAALGEGPQTADGLVAAADVALYRAKRAGRNRTHVARVPAGVRGE